MRCVRVRLNRRVDVPGCLQRLALGGLICLVAAVCARGQPRQVSGIYPNLAMFNEEDECGTGAVVPWAGRLWAVTYAPHRPNGSTDKLYEITPDLRQIVRPESVGGTPANRMIHRESRQLFIGPYAIDDQGRVRAIEPGRMFGRLTGNARHLFDPAGKIYCATMEEGLYEIDVATLRVTELWADEQRSEGRHAELPGYHGKGLYSGQGRLVYANNGEHGPRALREPDLPSGVLAQWDGRAEAWQVVRRNQFTEVTGPGGIRGNEDPEHDPIWTIGWDHRSLILMALEDGQWRSWRLPKGSHAYDGAHGWNTEWPRIREIGEDSLLMTMHGLFWRFPRAFGKAASAGLAPRSAYLKVVGDFCRWDRRLVFGCDDSARSEFLNRRKAKGRLAGPGKSQSNLWFVEPARLDTLGPALGRGAVWLEEDLADGAISDPFLFSGFRRRMVHLAHRSPVPVEFAFEVDRRGDDRWEPLRTVRVSSGGYASVVFGPEEVGAWIRVRLDRTAQQVSAVFHYGAEDGRGSEPASLFAGLARPNTKQATGGLLLARGGDFRTLRCVARDASGELGGYDLDGDLNLRRVDDPTGVAWTRTNAAVPPGVLEVDAASVLYVDDAGQRWRLPMGDEAFDRPSVLGEGRVCREVCTERDLFQAHGTFYELPAENAGGFARIRPIASHGYRVFDYASYRGLLVLSGLDGEARGEHVVRSDDGRFALWVGAVDDLWQLGKPRGRGGPWKLTPVKAGHPSDPYLMTGYDRKRMLLSHAGTEAVRFRVQVDFTGVGRWHEYGAFTVSPGRELPHVFPAGYSAYWVRVIADRDTAATAWFVYE